LSVGYINQLSSRVGRRSCAAVVRKQHQQHESLAWLDERCQNGAQRPVQVIAESVDAECWNWCRTDLLRHWSLQGRCRRTKAHQEGSHSGHTPSPAGIQRGQRFIPCSIYHSPLHLCQMSYL